MIYIKLNQTVVFYILFSANLFLLKYANVTYYVEKCPGNSGGNEQIISSVLFGHKMETIRAFLGKTS